MFSSQLIAIGLLATVGSAINITVSATGGNLTSPLQYGIMFEDINYSGDGGIYAELIRNRAFKGSTVYPSTVEPWEAVGQAVLSLQTTEPTLSSALPTYLHIATNATGIVGIKNPGWWGIDVQPQTYKGTFWASGSYDGNFTAQLQGTFSDDIWATTEIQSANVAGTWTEYNFTLTPAISAPNSNNSFTLSWTPTAGSSLNIGFVSLFPPTYKDRPNGMRIGLMEALKDLNPSFLRMPGGNNLEGNDPPFYWKWNETIGPLIDRPGRPGTWDYPNTDGLGLVEYLQWCDDLELEPILAVWAGFYLNGPAIAEADLGSYVQDTLDELEFIMGDVSTPYGALRESLGYPDPWTIKYVEVGNEDNLGGGGSTYQSYRFQAYYDAIHAKYPDILIIASTNAYDFPDAPGSGVDYHHYTRPDEMVTLFDLFDNVDGSHPTLIGEYAIINPNNGNPSAGADYSVPRPTYPWWIGSVSEAVFTIGAERNADKILGASYAPLLQNLNSYQWTPDLISFVADNSKDVLSTSYYGIKLFSGTRMTEVLPETHDTAFGPAYWVAGVNNITNQHVFKAATYNATSPVPFSIGFGQTATEATLTVLTAPDPYSSSVLDGTNPVIDTVTTLTASDGVFSFELPNYAIALLVTEV